MLQKRCYYCGNLIIEKGFTVDDSFSGMIYYFVINLVLTNFMMKRFKC